jgi:UDP-3-O-[3-hydroxymyristoyl] glucosamine N-acyltransferase
MPDRRFFDSTGPVSLEALASLAGAEFGPGCNRLWQVFEAAPLDKADERCVSFLSDKRYLDDLRTTRAGVVFVAARHAPESPAGTAVLITPEPQAAWSRAALRLHAPRMLADGAARAASVELEEDVVLAPGVVLGEGVRIGRGSRIGANTVLGPGVAIGRNCQIGSNVSIGFALVGDRVRVASGAVIGEAGFGLAVSRAGAIDIPQLGRVILQDDVSVGANSCIDRGAYEDTVIGEGTKIDNLVQVGHNVTLGRGCVLVAHTGLSGSVKAGDGVQFGGKAGLADHLNIGSGAKIAAGAGVISDVPAGETWAGYPARPIRRWLREAAWVAKQARKPQADDAE